MPRRRRSVLRCAPRRFVLARARGAMLGGSLPFYATWSSYHARFVRTDLNVQFVRLLPSVPSLLLLSVGAVVYALPFSARRRAVAFAKRP